MLSILVCMFCVAVKAQDIHYTQWMQAPYQYNPASTGQFDGNHRFHLNHRNQWSSVTVPFLTFGAMADSRTLLPVKGLHAMSSFLYDVTGDSKFTTIHFQLGVAYEIPLGLDSVFKWKVGMQSSINQKRLSLRDLVFDDQFDGFLNNPSLGTNENLSRLSRSYFDIALGSEWAIKVSDKMNLNFGLSWFNILKPQQSFFNDNAIILNPRYNIMAQADWKLDKKWTMHPGILYSAQANYQSFNWGTLMSLDVSENIFFTQKLLLGGYIRARDAGSLMVGYQYDAWKAMLSYDINYSDLVPASNYRGGLELALIYILKNPPIRPLYKNCPDYL